MARERRAEVEAARLAAEEDMFSDIALGEVATETSLDDIQF